MYAICSHTVEMIQQSPLKSIKCINSCTRVNPLISFIFCILNQLNVTSWETQLTAESPPQVVRYWCFGLALMYVYEDKYENTMYAILFVVKMFYFLVQIWWRLHYVKTRFWHDSIFILTDSLWINRWTTMSASLSLTWLKRNIEIAYLTVRNIDCPSKRNIFIKKKKFIQK